MTSNTSWWVALIAVAIIAVGGYFYPQVQHVVAGAVGGITNYNSLGVSQLKIGPTCNDEFGYNNCNSGNAINAIQFGTCNFIVNGTIAASSTRNYDCAVTGALTTDTNVFANLPATSTSVSQGVDIIGCNGSTTASGFITCTFSNGTGATYNPSVTGLGSSTPYLIHR